MKSKEVLGEKQGGLSWKLRRFWVKSKEVLGEQYGGFR